jgi:dipeptidase
MITRATAFATCLVAVAAANVWSGRPAEACTNFLVTKGASVDGSTMITYAADSHTLYGELYYYAPAKHRPGSKREIIEWDTGRKIGFIPEAPQTYRVVGNINEHQVAIGETTFGGREELVDPDGGIDYGSLMYVALQRSKTAREAIDVMTKLASEHGYCSEGESFSVADPNEAWILEMVGKGKGGHGAVWVARRVPDGYVSAHANNPRIRQFPRNDPDTIFSPDVVSFARSKGYFNGRDEDFSFADAFAPLNFESIRFCDARVWQFFRRVAPSKRWTTDYVKVAPGAQPLPIWIRPDTKLSAADVMSLMRDHFEGTEFDLSKGVGAGPYGCPYRWRPLTWKVSDVDYFNERSTSTQQTGFSFVTQSRASLPGPVGGLLWFGVDDTDNTVYVPMYAGITKAPRSFAVGTATFDRFSWDSAWWVFNFVANLAYTRYSDIHADVRVAQKQLEDRFLADQAGVEAQAAKLYKRSPAAASAFLTRYSTKAGDDVTTRWRTLGEQLFVKYLDGNVRDAQGKVTHPGYPEGWYRRIAADSGDALKVREYVPSPAPLVKAPPPAPAKTPPAPVKIPSPPPPPPPVTH